MPDKLEFKLTKDSQRKLKILAKAGKVDLRPTMKTVGIGYRKEVKSIFEKRQPRQAGLRWAELSEPYRQFKEIQFPGRPILVRTGALKRSMTEQGAPGNITLISKASAVFGSSVPYGIFHDEGTSRMPQRNFSEPSQRRFDIWKKQIARAIIRNFEKNNVKVEGEIFVND